MAKNFTFCPVEEFIRILVKLQGYVLFLHLLRLYPRITYGPAYRIYYTEKDKRIIVLLCAGDKSTQPEDVEKAKQYLKDYLVSLGGENL